MKLRRIGAMLLCLSLVLSMMVSPVCAEEQKSITVTLTVSMYGNLVEEATFVPVELSGKSSYTLDDVFEFAHILYYDGEDGYLSDFGEYGAYVTKFWGDESGNFGYQINGGTKYVGGLNTYVDDGDFVDVAIYENKYPDTEMYSKFDKYKLQTHIGKEIELILLKAEYDENWNMVFLPCEGACVTADGVEYFTDAEGKVTIVFEKSGKYIVSANMSKVVKEKEVTAITAPVCEVTVVEPHMVMLENIADLYSSEEILSDGNMIWFLADLTIYNQLYPDKEKSLAEDLKQRCIDKIIADAVGSSKPNVLAKSIISLRALGYDAREVYDKTLRKNDIVSKLIAMIDEELEDVVDIYTISYVLLALNQGENYIAEEQIEYLINYIIENKESWQNDIWGTDAASAMLLALAPYYEINEDVRCVVDETILIIKDKQTETGIIGNAASTGLAMVALSAFGIDSSEVINNERTLVDGLMSMATEELDGFEPMENSFSTEQGFRGLLAWELLKNNKGFMYNFKLNSMDVVRATWEPEGCPVTFNVVPESAEIKITNVEPVDKNKYDLSEGEYTYIVTSDGYKAETNTFTISSYEAENHILKNINVFLNKKSSNSGGGGSFRAEREEENEVKNEEKVIEEVEQESTAKIEKLYEETTFQDVKIDDWYYNSVKYVYEKNLMQGTEKGFEPDNEMTRAMLVTVLYRMEDIKETLYENKFNDVLKDEWYSDAVIWAANNNIVSGIADGIFAGDEYITREQMAAMLYRYAKFKGIAVDVDTELLSFEDSSEISHWAVNALKWASDTKIINGTSDVTVSPKETATRAQVATILMRFSECCKDDNE